MLRFSNFRPNCFSSASKSVIRPSGTAASGAPADGPIAAWAGDMRESLKLRVKA
jgi:hypothetical protein